jgi:hypothetical protein
MAKCEIQQGGVYANANEFLAREVIAITPDGDVIYDDYALSDGKPFGRQCRCSLNTFMQWAARPVTPEENSLLRRDEGEARDRAKVEMMTQFGLAAASDEQIRREFYRRGLDRVSDSGQSRRDSDGGDEGSRAGTAGSPSKSAGRSKKPSNGRRN